MTFIVLFSKRIQKKPFVEAPIEAAKGLIKNRKRFKELITAKTYKKIFLLTGLF